MCIAHRKCATCITPKCAILVSQGTFSSAKHTSFFIVYNVHCTLQMVQDLWENFFYCGNSLIIHHHNVCLRVMSIIIASIIFVPNYKSLLLVKINMYHRKDRCILIKQSSNLIEPAELIYSIYSMIFITEL